MAQAHPVCQRLRTIPGLRDLATTARGAAVSDAPHFKNGRQFAAWLGLGPRQHSPGGKPRLVGISKRGEVYLRTLLVHRAGSYLRWVGGQRDRRSQWVRALVERRGWNRTAVALAKKNARVAWVFMGTEQVYRAEKSRRSSIEWCRERVAQEPFGTMQGEGNDEATDKEGERNP